MYIELPVRSPHSVFKSHKGTGKNMKEGMTCLPSQIRVKRSLDLMQSLQTSNPANTCHAVVA